MATRIGNLLIDLTLQSARFQRDMRYAANMVNSNTAKMNRSFARVDRSMKRLTRTTQLWVSSLVATAGAYATGRLIQDMLKVGIQAERMGKGLKAATGSVEAANKAQQMLKQTSEELGLVFVSQVEGYKKLAAAARGTKLEGEGIDEVYRALVESATALQLSQQDVELTLYAVTQMISKGKVSMEELRRQLGERLPGAFQTAARAMGMTTQELDEFVSSGKLMAEDFLPRFARALREQYAGAWQESANTAQAQINRLKNAFFEIQTTIMDSGVLDTFTEALKRINEGLKEWNENGRGVIATMKGLGKTLEIDPAEWWIRGRRHPDGPMPVGSERDWRGREMQNYGGAKSYFGSGLGGLGKTGATATGPEYLGADYLAKTDYLRPDAMFDLEKMAENAQAGKEIIDDHIDELVRQYIEWEHQAIESAVAIQQQVDDVVMSMSSAFTEFFDATSQGFLDLEKLVLNIGRSLLTSGVESLVNMGLGALSGAIGGSLGGTGTAGGFDPTASFFDFQMDGGGYLGENVVGRGVATGKSYQFHADEFVTPSGAGGGQVNNYYISTLDAKSFKQAFGPQIRSITAEGLNANDQELWGALSRRR